MMPVAADTKRMALFLVSAMNKLPVLSTATPDGAPKRALVAAPPSPTDPDIPGTPAYVVMMPVAADTKRMALL
jgi:hypothetical protein